jgi:hypothetical protein
MGQELSSLEQDATLLLAMVVLEVEADAFCVRLREGAEV